MAKPKTKTLRIALGDQLHLSVKGQSGNAVCSAGALEGGNWTNWSPQALDSGVFHTPQGPCTIEFLADFLTQQAGELTVAVAAPQKQVTWTVKAADGERQTWQLWVLTN